MTKKRSKLRTDAPRLVPTAAAAAERRYLTVEEWEQVRDVLNDACLHAVQPAKVSRTLRDRALILTMYAVGARRDEPGTWTLDYLKQLHNKKIYVFRGKGSVEGFCEVPEYVADVLAEWVVELYPDVEDRQREAYVFPGIRHKGQPAEGISDRSVYRIYNTTAATAGLPKHLRHPHALKRSRGQHLLERGIAEGRTAEEMIPIIARVLGHKNTAVTRKHYLAETQADRDLVRRVSDEMVAPLEALREQGDE